MKLDVDRPSIGALSVVVILTTLATAAIHLYLVPAEFDKGATGYGTLFIFALVGIASAAIIAYLALGFFDTLGWVTKAIEAVLVVAAVAEAVTAGDDQREARAPTVAESTV